MKRTKEELVTRVNDLEVDDEIKISLMEDISDSMGVNENLVDEVIVEDLKRENEELKWKYEDLKVRYKERFLSDNDETDEKDEVIEENKEEVIDVTEI